LVHHGLECSSVTTEEGLELVTDLLVTIGSCEELSSQFGLPLVDGFLTLLLKGVDSRMLDVLLFAVTITEFLGLVSARALLLVDSVLLLSVKLLEVVHQSSFLVCEVFVYVGGNFVDRIL